MPDSAPEPPVAPLAADLPSALRSIEPVEGWLTEAQASRLWHAARALRPGSQIVEIGSFRGRSTIALAMGAPDGPPVIAIDPHAGNDRGPQEIHGYEREAEDDNTVFHANLRAAGVEDRVRHIRRFAAEAEEDVAGPVALLYIDGAHRFRPARDDLVRWGKRVPVGGRILVHDAFSSVGVTLALAAVVVPSDRLRYVGRSGSLVEYEVRPMSIAARMANLARHLTQLPWFLRNVVIKVLLVAKRPDLARRLGHDGLTWPY